MDNPATLGEALAISAKRYAWHGLPASSRNVGTALADLRRNGVCEAIQSAQAFGGKRIGGLEFHISSEVAFIGHSSALHAYKFLAG
jgi:hypothetical protein